MVEGAGESVVLGRVIGSAIERVYCRYCPEGHYPEELVMRVIAMIEVNGLTGREMMIVISGNGESRRSGSDGFRPRAMVEIRVVDGEE